MRTLRVITFLVTIFGLLLSLSGCSPKFACSDDIYSGEPLCSSVSAMYNSKMRGMEDRTTMKSEEKPASKKTRVPNVPAVDQGVEILKQMTYSSTIPVRVPPKIVRIWLAPWEDSDGDLNQPGFVFSEVNDKRGRWLFGEKENASGQPMLKQVEQLTSGSDGSAPAEKGYTGREQIKQKSSTDGDEFPQSTKDQPVLKFSK